MRSLRREREGRREKRRGKRRKEKRQEKKRRGKRYLSDAPLPAYASVNRTTLL